MQRHHSISEIQVPSFTVAPYCVHFCFVCLLLCHSQMAAGVLVNPAAPDNVQWEENLFQELLLFFSYISVTKNYTHVQI